MRRSSLSDLFISTLLGAIALATAPGVAAQSRIGMPQTAARQADAAVPEDLIVSALSGRPGVGAILARGVSWSIRSVGR